MRALLSLLLFALVVIAATTVTAQTKRRQPKIRDLTELHSFVSVEYDWAGSPWPSRGAAIAAGAFIPENNIVTGVNEYQGTVFVCVPRWRPGVPSTLNRVEKHPVTQQSILVPFPNWEMNTKLFHYVQSVFVDQTRGWMYVIDTGRENFEQPNASLIQNRTASLYVLDLKSPGATKILYQHTFPDAVFPVNSSFLNDIVVDMEKNIAYMSDTNMAGRGAIVVHDLNTRFTRRFEDPKSTYANTSYTISINGISYPMIRAPADGIAIDDFGDYVYYSALDGTALYQLNAQTMSDPSKSNSDVLATVRLMLQKESASDGLKIMPSPQPGLVEHLVYGSNCFNSVVDAAFEPRRSNPAIVVGQTLLEKDDYSMQWTDTFARVDINGTADSHLYFTTNRLQLWATGTMDWSGNSGANMRVYRLLWKLEPEE